MTDREICILLCGADFAVKKLRREIRVFGKNALTELKIKFEQAAPRDPPQEQAISAGTEQPLTTENTAPDDVQKQGCAFGQNFVICPTDGRAEVKNFIFVRPKAEPKLSDCPKSARLGLRLFSDIFRHDLGQSDSRISESPRTFWKQNSYIFNDFYKNYSQ